MLFSLPVMYFKSYCQLTHLTKVYTLSLDTKYVRIQALKIVIPQKGLHPHFGRKSTSM